MVLRYYDGEVDERPCIGVRYNITFTGAEMVNPDGSLSIVIIDDYDSGCTIAKAVIDATEEDRERVRRFSKVGHAPRLEQRGTYDDIVRPGDRVRIVKGRKYPVGTEFTVEGSFMFRKDHVEVPYVYGDGIKVSAKNCIVVDCA